MTTEFDKIFGKLATDLIGKAGTPVVIVRESSTYDVVTGDNVKTQTNHDVKISPPVPIKNARLKDGSVFQTGDLTCLVARADLSIEPNPTSDRLIYRDCNYQIVEVNPLVSGDLDAAYELVCRI